MNKKTKKKIAFCFSGQARTLDLCLPYIKKYMLDTMGKNGKDYDVFCCVADDEDADKVNMLNPKKILKMKTTDYNKIHGDLLKQNYKKFFGRGNLNAHLNQLNAIFLANKIKNEYEKEKNISYDWIFRARFDVFLLKEINYKELDKNMINIPQTKELRFPNSNDMIAISNKRNMDIYCDHINQFRDILKTFFVNYNNSQKISFFFERQYLLVLNFIIKKLRKESLISKILKKLIIIRENFFMRPTGKSYYTLESSLYRHLKKNRVKIKTFDWDFLLIRKDHKESGIYLGKQPW